MIGRDAVAAEALTADFRAVAGFDSLPPNWRKLFDDVLASAVDDRVPGAILPAPVGTGCKIYAVTADQKEWRRLRPLLYAYMGRFVPQSIVQPQSLVERARAEASGD